MADLVGDACMHDARNVPDRPQRPSRQVDAAKVPLSPARGRRRSARVFWRGRGHLLVHTIRAGDSPVAVPVALRSARGDEDGRMIEEEARRRIAAARVGRLASVSPNGRPHVVPICFALSGDRVVSVVDRKPKRTVQLQRLENVRRTPDVQLVVDHYDDDWSSLWWIRISGRGRVIEYGNEREEAIDLLVAKYRQYREHRPTEPALLIEIAQISSWQATIS